MEWIRKAFETAPAVLDYKIFDLAGTPVTVATVLVFLLIVVLTFLASRLAQKTVSRALAFRKVSSTGSIAVAERLVHYAVLAVGLSIALQTIGINLSALFAAGAVFAIGLGFAMQNIMQNFVSGLILLTERTIKPDDVLQVDQEFIRVSHMGIRATVAQTLDNEEIIVPNSMLVQSMVKNYTLQDSNYRVRAVVGVTYASDMRRVREALERASKEMQERNLDFEPVVLLHQFGSSSVDWEVSIWIVDPWNLRRAKSMLHETIWNALKEAGIVIAFPQLDLHLDEPALQALRPTG